MYERILVTFDGSDLSEAAIPAAQKLAGGTNAEVTIVTVAEPPKARLKRVERSDIVPEPQTYGAVVKPEFEEVEPQGDVEQRITSDLQSQIREVAAPLTSAGVHVTPVVKFGDDVADTIVGYANDWNADAIVMATHGRSGISEAVFGSVAHAVLKSGVAPVVLVKNGA